MNRSGEAVRAVLDWYKLDPASVLVVYDDMDLPLGRLRLRGSGSAGGHNGMKSVIEHLGSEAFPACAWAWASPKATKTGLGMFWGALNPLSRQCWTGF